VTEIANKVRLMLKRTFEIGLIILALITSSSGCATSTPVQSVNSKDTAIVGENYSLKKDRSDLDELRKNIPPEKKQTNDESAYMKGLFADANRDPIKIREEFSTYLRKKRELLDKDLNSEREKFTLAERNAREEFSRKQSEERADLAKSKLPTVERKRRLDDLEIMRKSFYGEQKDKRSAFESSVRERRKNYEDYVRSKNSEFSEQLVQFSKAQAELKKKQKEDLANKNKKFEQEFNEVKKEKGTRLESGEN
jgi:hypothetical protein